MADKRTIKKPKNWDSVYQLWKARKIKSKEAVKLSGLTNYAFYVFIGAEKEKERKLDNIGKHVRESYGAWRSITD